MTAFGQVLAKPYVMYHGGRLDGAVGLRTRAMSMAYGPGFYMTTSYWTAREYRGGNGFVYRITFDGRVRWADDVRLTRAEVARFLAEIPKLKRRDDVMEDLDVSFGRTNDGKVSMVNVLNVLSNNGSYGASVAEAVAAAVVAAGCDASLIEGANGSDEDWVVLHNTTLVLKVEKLDGPEPDLLRLRPR